MNDKEKILTNRLKMVLDMVEYMLENSNKQSEHTWYNNTIDDLVGMRNFLKSKE